MRVSNPGAIIRLQQLFDIPRASVEKEFSPYFYQYFSSFFKNPDKFIGYLELWRYLFDITKARNTSYWILAADLV